MMRFLKPRILLAGIFLLTGFLSSAGAMAQVALNNIAFSSLPGDRFQIELSFSDTPPEPEVFMIENPGQPVHGFCKCRRSTGQPQISP